MFNMDRYAASIRNIPMPDRIARLPISPDFKMPIPWFVAEVNGKRDFRIADYVKFKRALQADLCWLCGNTLGRFKCFTVGPMCAVNRTSSEPPAHRTCAEYAVRACPFLSKPRMRRNDVDLPPDHVEPGGIMIERNPGVTLLWITHDYRVFNAGGRPLINMGDPVELVAYAEGRLATREEIDKSIVTGLPALAREAEQEGVMRELTAAMDRVEILFKAKLPQWRPAA